MIAPVTSLTSQSKIQYRLLLGPVTPMSIRKRNRRSIGDMAPRILQRLRQSPLPLVPRPDRGRDHLLARELRHLSQCQAVLRKRDRRRIGHVPVPATGLNPSPLLPLSGPTPYTAILQHPPAIIGNPEIEELRLLSDPTPDTVLLQQALAGVGDLEIEVQVGNPDPDLEIDGRLLLEATLPSRTAPTDVILNRLKGILHHQSLQVLHMDQADPLVHRADALALGQVEPRRDNTRPQIKVTTAFRVA